MIRHLQRNILGGSGGIGPYVNDVTIQADGKILVGGLFTTVNGVAKNSFVRLNSDGSLDTTYPVQIGIGSVISTIIIQNDGKVMLAGTFSGVSGVNRSNLARLNSDGTVDTSFNARSIQSEIY